MLRTCVASPQRSILNFCPFPFRVNSHSSLYVFLHHFFHYSIHRDCTTMHFLLLFVLEYLYCRSCERSTRHPFPSPTKNGFTTKWPNKMTPTFPNSRFGEGPWWVPFAHAFLTCNSSNNNKSNHNNNKRLGTPTITTIKSCTL